MGQPFYRLMVYSFSGALKLCISTFRSADNAAKIVAECGILVAGADPLIHDNVQRHHLPAQIPGHVVGHGLAHTYEHAGGAKLVAVVVDITGLDRGQIGDEQPCSRRR